MATVSRAQRALLAAENALAEAMVQANADPVAVLGRVLDEYADRAESHLAKTRSSVDAAREILATLRRAKR